MTGSTHTPSLQVENLLRALHAEFPKPAAAPAASRRRRFGRPFIAAGLAFLVFAPGCAAAAVFLMRHDEIMPPALSTDNATSMVKSDRLPLADWSAQAAKDIASPADSLSEPMSIRGSVADDPIAHMAETPAAEAAVSEAPPKPRVKKQARRALLIRVVADVTPPPPEPGLLEKLFGSRFN